MERKHPQLKARPEPVTPGEIQKEIALLKKELEANFSLSAAIHHRIEELQLKLEPQPLQFDEWFQALKTLARERMKSPVGVDRYAGASEMYEKGMSPKEACNKIIGKT